MATKKRTFVIILISFIVICTLIASVLYFVSYQISRLDERKESITKTISEKLNRDVTYKTGKASLTFRAGLSLQFTNVVIMEKDRSSNFINIKTAFLRVSILPLLRNRIVLKDVILEEPHLIINRDREGVLNIADLLKRDKEQSLKIKELTVDKGFVKFIDQAAGENELVTSLENLYCKINSPFWGNKYRFKIRTSVVENNNKAELSLSGTYQPASSDRQVYESTVKASVILKGSDIKHYGMYLKKYVPIELMAGHVDVETNLSGKFSDFSSKGVFTVKNILLGYPGVFRGNVAPRMVQVDYNLKRKGGNLKLDVARLRVDRFEAKGLFAIKEMDKNDPLLEANAVASALSMKENQPYIPWGIIPVKVGAFIEAHIKDGNLRLIEGKLKGRLSQVAHMNKKESAGVLYIRGEVNKGVFVIGKNAPDFHDISGTLELKNRQFLLKNMKGSFGASPCTLNGGISDFALSPVVYSADVSVQPARDEIVRFLGKEKFHDLKFAGPSVLNLSGKGTVDNFQINAAWDLTDAAYQLPAVMDKPAKRKNQLNAKIVLNKDAANVPSFNYFLPPLSISGTVSRQVSGKMPVSFNVKSGNFDLRELVPILPALKEFDPAGTCLIDVNGSGDAGDYAGIQWKGGISLSNTSFKTLAGVRPVRGLTGKAFFKGNKMETSLFNAKIGESNVQGRFKIYDIRKPAFTCQFNADLLRTEDLGLQSGKGEVNLKDVKGQVVFEENHIRVDNISFKIGKSVFNLLGNVREFVSPKITATLTSPYISADDVAGLVNLELSKEAKSSSGMMVNATLLVDAGSFNDVDFKKLNAGVKYTPGVINIEKLDAGVFEGKIRIKGKVDILPSGNHYEGNISAEKLSLEKLQRYIKMGEREAKGNLSLVGDVSATGRNADDFKKTAVGTFKVNAEKGVLKKFTIISKIFSLLNVLQFAKLQLPDMAKDGMPYNEITAHAALKNGILSSEDFFIDSNAMEISGVGKVDIIRKKLDCLIGVHPLQTIDRLVSKIPIAGWLITDERGKLITVHFKIEGPWDDPNVSPVTAQSIGKGTLDIFRRLFHLPEKLITDTGEVILGH